MLPRGNHDASRAIRSSDENWGWVSGRETGRGFLGLGQRGNRNNPGHRPPRRGRSSLNMVSARAWPSGFGLDAFEMTKWHPMACRPICVDCIAKNGPKLLSKGDLTGDPP
jgi:hypothetical protein